MIEISKEFFLALMVLLHMEKVVPMIFSWTGKSKNSNTTLYKKDYNIIKKTNYLSKIQYR